MASYTEVEARFLAATPRMHTGHTKKISALAWSPNGATLATGSQDTTVRAWTIDATGSCRRSEVLKGHEGTVDAFAWNPSDPNALASGAADRTVRFWDVRTNKQTASVPIKGITLSMAWRAGSSSLSSSLSSSSASSSSSSSSSSSASGGGDGGVLAVGTRDDALHLIDPRKAAVLHVHQFPQELNDFAFTPSGLLFAALGYRGASVDEGQVGIFTVDMAAAASASAGGPSGAGGGAAAAASAASQPGATPAGAASALLRSPPAATAVQPAASASSAAASSSSSSAVVTEVARARGHTTPVVSLRFDPTYRTFATGAGDSVVGIWDAADVHCIRTLDRAESQIRGVSFTPTGDHIAIASGDKDDATKPLDIVRVADGTRIRSLSTREGVSFLSWAPHAHLLAYALDGATVAPGGGFGGPGAAAAAANAALEAGALRILAAT